MYYRNPITLPGLVYFIIAIAVLPSTLLASPTASLQRRTDPFFPDSPPSCPICAKSYPKINSCAQAAPVLANFSQIIFNPGAFISVIECSCTDTFQAAFPQCVDCFVQTNQTSVLNTPDLPAVLQGMRNICSISSVLLGGVATADGEVTPTSSSLVARPTSNDLSPNSGIPSAFTWLWTAIGVAISSVLLGLCL